MSETRSYPRHVATDGGDIEFRLMIFIIFRPSGIYGRLRDLVRRPRATPAAAAAA